MRFLWIRIRIFFTSKNTKHFFQVLLISFPLVFMSVFGLVILINTIHKQMDQKDIKKSFELIMQEPFPTNNQPVLDYFPDINQEALNINSDPEFWIGDAVHYRFPLTHSKSQNPSINKP